jgi:putative ABC transport system permease protein
MTGGDHPVQVSGARVTANLFQVLGVKPFMGRTFLRGEDGLDGSATVGRVVVIGYSLWQNALGSDPNVLGRTIRLNETPYAVVGVMPPGFELLSRRHQVWMPASLNAANRDYRYIYVLGRLKTTLAEASAEMMSMSLRLAEAFPGNNRGWVTEVDSFADWLVDKNIRARVLLLFAAVGMVLLLACSNVASLLLARCVSRSREIALRVSLGASRARILAQLLTESLMLSLAGGALGLALAAGLIRIAPSVMPPSAIRTTAPLQLSPLVIGFTAAVSILTGLLFGLAPALTALRARIQETLQDTTRGAAGGRFGRIFRQVMVMVQVAVALTLLSGALLMVQGIDQMGRSSLGVRPENVLVQRVLLPQSYNAQKALLFYQQAMERIAALPGVGQFGVGSNLPLNRLSMEVPFDLENAPVREIADMPSVGYTTTSPGYFASLGIPLLSGRDFTITDVVSAPQVAIINSAMAERYFPNQSPVGRRLRMNKPILRANDFGEPEYVEIVGVVGNVALGELGADAQPLLYAPMAQNLWAGTHYITIRTTGNLAQVTNAVRNVIMTLDPNQPVEEGTPLLASLDAQFAEPRFQSELMAVFALLALVLAVTGIYGSNSYAVTQRRREFGVRMALGATPGDIFMDVLTRGMRVTFIGVIVGIAGAASLATILSSVFVDIGSLAWLPTMGAALLLLLVAVAACYFPAVRATRVAPAVALRDE